jgi:hypothetical protein
MFSVSPCITPVAVTILTGTVIGILGCNRFSISGAIVPASYANDSAYKVIPQRNLRPMIVKEIWDGEDGLKKWEYYSDIG